MQNINFMKCAAENFPNISTEFNVTAVPTILFFKNGRQVDELTGADPVLLNNKLQKYVSIFFFIKIYLNNLKYIILIGNNYFQ